MPSILSDIELSFPEISTELQHSGSASGESQLHNDQSHEPIDGINAMSLSPTYPDTSPLAMVLMMSFGRPILRERMTDDARSVDVDPPRLITPRRIP